MNTDSMLADDRLEEETMPKYVIERELPGAGNLSAEELQGISTKSNHVISELGPEIRWLTSYVTDDKLYCIYVAPDEDILLEHARCGAFPADRISKVSAVIDPSTADAATANV
jgi:Nickel responsive protein SCO4226-like